MDPDQRTLAPASAGASSLIPRLGAEHVRPARPALDDRGGERELLRILS